MQEETLREKLEPVPKVQEPFTDQFSKVLLCSLSQNSRLQDPVPLPGQQCNQYIIQ